MKKNNLLIIIFGVLLALGAGFYFLVLRKPARTTPTSESPKPTQISWQFEDMGQDPRTEHQLTKVKMGIEDKTYDLGIYEGKCSVMPVYTLVKDEISGVVCWLAGGDEIGVFKENGKLVVKTRGLTESPYYPDTDFKETLKIK